MSGVERDCAAEAIASTLLEQKGQRVMLECVSLVPEWHLLPKMQGASGQGDSVGMLDVSYDGFFGSGSETQRLGDFS